MLFRSTFKLQALDNMRQTIDALSKEVGKAQVYLERARAAEGGASGELKLPSPGIGGR